MRLVQVLIPSEMRETVVALLEDRGLGYAMTAETSGRTTGTIVSVPIATDEVEGLLDELRETGIGRDDYAIVTDVEAVLSENGENEPTSTDEEQTGLLTSGRISREELQAEATELAAITSNYVFFTVVSAVVAGAGLLTDSAAVIVGSMVIAPLFGPAVGASVGSIVNDEKLFRTSVLAQCLGLVLAVVSATVFAYALKFTIMPTVELQTVDEVVSRINPGALSLVIALGSGAAGAFSVSAGASAPLVGVMIAAALIPPATAVGLSIAYWSPVVLTSVSVLLIVNVLSINFSSLGVLWLRGYRPTHWYEQEIVKRTTLKRLGTLFIGLLIVSGFLVTTSINLKENTEFKESVEKITADSDARIRSVEISYEIRPFTRVPTTVTVHAETDANQLADRLQRRIKNRTHTDVSVVVVRETIETSGNTSLHTTIN